MSISKTDNKGKERMILNKVLMSTLLYVLESNLKNYSEKREAKKQD